jgi:hypothetical protein
MSDFAAIATMLAIFLLGAITVSALGRLMYKRSDDLLSGIVNGVPMQLRTRWYFLIHDYLALSFGVTVVLGVSTIGFIAASEIVGESARVVAWVCALGSGGFFVFNLMFGINWMMHFVSILRQAEAD